MALELVPQQISIPRRKYISYSQHCLNMDWAMQDWRCINGDRTSFRHDSVGIYSVNRHKAASEMGMRVGMRESCGLKGSERGACGLWVRSLVPTPKGVATLG